MSQTKKLSFSFYFLVFWSFIILGFYLKIHFFHHVSWTKKVQIQQAETSPQTQSSSTQSELVEAIESLSVIEEINSWRGDDHHAAFVIDDSQP